MTDELPDPKYVINVVKPVSGDVIILQIKDHVPIQQLRAFRRQVWNLMEEQREKTGVHFTFLVLNSDIAVHAMTREERLELLHDNRVVLNDDGSVINTLQGIEDDP